MFSSPLITGRTKLFADLALKHRLPAIAPFTDFARDDGLMAYGSNLLAFVRQGSVMAAKSWGALQGRRFRCVSTKAG
jgi:putative ABC transport system substrate-binding protein